MGCKIPKTTLPLKPEMKDGQAYIPKAAMTKYCGLEIKKEDAAFLNDT
jgi:hypothetical protein